MNMLGNVTVIECKLANTFDIYNHKKNMNIINHLA